MWKIFLFYSLTLPCGFVAGLILGETLEGDNGTGELINALAQLAISILQCLSAGTFMYGATMVEVFI